MNINETLTSLDLGCDDKIGKKKEIENGKKRMNNGTDNEIGAEGAKAISEAMKINATLTELDLFCDEKKERNGEKKKK